jgi:hypothetical protein
MKFSQNVVGNISAISLSLQNHRPGLLALGLGIGVLLAACSGGSMLSNLSNESPAEAQDSTTAQDTLPAASQDNATGQDAVAAASQDTTTSDSVSPDPSVSAANDPPAASQDSTTDQNALPGTEEFGMTKEQLVRSIEGVESLIAKCMSEAGFEYIAVDYATVRRGMVSDKSLPGYSEKQYFDQFGFGISTLYTGLPPQLADVNTPAKIGLGEQNIQIFNNLSPADQVAYNRTLLGENTDATFAVVLETEDFSRVGGCTLAAIEQVFTPEQLKVTYLNPLDALIEQDPRMVAALADFVECLRSAGFDYSREREIEPDLKKRLYAITGGAPIESLSADARAALTELQGEERAIAATTYDCEVSIIEPVEDQVERELYAAPVQ